MFYHAFDNYMLHAYPLDELKPLSCQGKKEGREVWTEYREGDLIYLCVRLWNVNQ